MIIALYLTIVTVILRVRMCLSAWVLERDFSQLYRHEHTLNIFTNKYILIKININVQVKRVNIN